MREPVTLEIDAFYTIGKSIAVLHGGNVSGHLAKRVAPQFSPFSPIGMNFDGSCSSWHREVEKQGMV